LSKTMTHSGNGTFELNPTKKPAYMTVYLKDTELADEFKRKDPKFLLDNSLKKKEKNKSDGTSILAANGTTFETRVSFDTVNIKYLNEHESDIWSQDDDFTHDVGMRQDYESNRRQQLLDAGGWGSTSSNHRDPSPGRNRGRSPTDRDMSPRSDSIERSSSPKSHHSSRLGSVSPIRNANKQTGLNRRHYPTEPIITHDACTLTKKHQDFDKLYSGQLKPKTAKLPNRNILCYVSGRRHTWVSIDWICNRLLEDGDTLIVIASINPKSSSSLRRRLSSTTPRSASPPPLISEENIKKSPEYAKIVTENLMKYILAITNPRKIIKITIEFAVGSTKDVLKDMYSLYLPSIVVIAAKPSMAESTKSWATSRITDRLVKNFPVPVIIVPSLNMNLFETKMFKALNKVVKTGLSDENVLKELDHSGSYELHDRRRDIMNTSMEDDEDAEPADKLKRMELSTEAKIYLELEELASKPFDDNTFKDWLCIVSEAAYNYGISLAESAKTGGESAKLVRTLTGAPDLSYSKKKSMLLDDTKTSSGATSPPSIDLSPTNTSGFGISGEPRAKTSLKFDISHPKYESLTPGDSLTTRPQLEPSRSSPQLTTVKSNSSMNSTKEKKGSFVKRF
ncbi:hypothetical protein CANARDRAFT_182148, partial [[Candida] arabinofermentans NRRL YB-2248]